MRFDWLLVGLLEKSYQQLSRVQACKINSHACTYEEILGVLITIFNLNHKNDFSLQKNLIWKTQLSKMNYNFKDKMS